ncbi:MAG: phosphoribosyl-AMP cyclohydrolase [Thermomicrobiales bacterium]|nr:phosphoribosyl-AMP cyclohydrolase [Thermomicrobiales bacterium]MCO5222373.1 phosphoribosyl-AMP cyclohydrolase [Thermomicrobiales bacterium]
MTFPIDFDANPLVPVVIQDDITRDVLMVAFMNRDAYERTMETGFVHFWSRSRNTLWKKGETSGHTQEVVSISINCEDNSLLIQVLQKGAVCHTGHRTCYYRQILPDGALVETSDAVFDPAVVYGTETGRLEERWYGAYRYLRDNDLTAMSGTSRMVRGSGPPPLNRVADELEELAGVLAGEHVHEGLEADLLLEGSQVLYWIAVCGVMLDLDHEHDLEISAGLTAEAEIRDLGSIIDDLRSHAELLAQAESDAPEFDLKEAVWLVGAAMGVAEIEPIRLIERDLAELRRKPYLADYFASAGA